MISSFFDASAAVPVPAALVWTEISQVISTVISCRSLQSGLTLSRSWPADPGERLPSALVLLRLKKIVHGKACTVRRVVVLGVVLARRAVLRSREHKPRALRRDRASRGAHSVIRGKPGQACKDGNDGGQHKQTAHQEILPEILEGPHMLVGSLAVLGRRLVLLELAMSVHATHRLRLPC